MVDSLKHLLVVSWAMPPLQTPRSVQVSRLLIGLARRGWRSKVVCFDPSQTPQGYNLDMPFYKIVSGYYDCIPVTIKSYSEDPLMKSWEDPVLKTIQQVLAKNKFNAVLTFAQPWVDHLIGLKLKKRIHMPWIAHFSDPWIDNIYYHRVEPEVMKKWKKFEYNIIEKADAVIFTNAQARDLVMGKYPLAWQDKTAVIPHSFDRTIKPDVIAKEGKRRLRMIYTGDLYGDRSPEGLLKALEYLGRELNLEEKMDVAFYGRYQPEHQQQVLQAGLDKVVSFRPQAPYLESLAYIQESDVLLLIDAPKDQTSPFLPSKLVDYLMFSLPILGLTPLQGASVDLLRKLGCKVIAPDDVPGIVAALKELIFKWENNALKVGPEFEEIASKYDIDQVSEEAEQIILQTIQKTAIKNNFITRLIKLLT